MKIVNIILCWGIISAQVSSNVAFNNEGYLDVGAFNIQIFGQAVMKSALAREILPKIILRYDLILVQEIRDSSGEAIYDLMSLVRQIDDRYKLIVSERLGRSSSKEQYAYIYRSDWLKPLTSYVFHDVNDVFEREPFVAHFESTFTEVSDFIVIGIHTKPDDAGPEISHLVSVYDDAVAKTNTENAILMGDFNAGCTYVKSFENIALATDPRFYWLFDNKADTTTKRTDCPYDRVVLAGNALLNSVVVGSSQVFDFGVFYELSDKQTQELSDHFPVQFQIKSKYLSDNTIQQREYEVNDKKINTGLTSRKIYSMKKTATELDYQVKSEYTSSGAYLKIHISSSASGKMNTLHTLDRMRKDFPDFVSPYEELSILNWMALQNPLRYLPRGSGDYKTLYDFVKSKENQITTELVLSCSLEDRSKPICTVLVKQRIV